MNNRLGTDYTDEHGFKSLFVTKTVFIRVIRA